MMEVYDDKAPEHPLVVTLWLMTLGLYGLVWLYKTSEELIQYNKKSDNPLAWTILALMPPFNVLVIWWHTQAVAKLSSNSDGKAINAEKLFVSWFPWLPAVPTVGAIISQKQLNKHAHGIQASRRWPDV